MARPKGDIQDRILAAARECFFADGVEAASLRQIAKLADTSIGMVYYYYTTKDDLFLAVVEDVYQRFLTDLEASLGCQNCFHERMKGFYARFAAMSPLELDVVRLIVRESLTSSDRRARLMHRFLRGHLPLVLRAILEGVDAGEISKEVHPMVVMACTLGWCGVTTMLTQVGKKTDVSCNSAEAAPDFMREVAKSFAAAVPSSELLVEQLSQLICKAFAPQ